MTGRAAAALAAAFAACVTAGCGSLAMQDDAPARVDAALKAYGRSLAARDAAGAAAAFARDAELQTPDDVWLKTPDQIRAYLGSLAGAESVETDMKVESLHVVGPSALQMGTYRLHVRGPGAGTDAAGRFEAEWGRQADGSWLLERLQMKPPPFVPTDVGVVP